MLTHRALSCLAERGIPGEGKFSRHTKSGKGETVEKKQLVKDLERDAAGLRWLGKNDAARALEALAVIAQSAKLDSISDFELWARTIEREHQPRQR